MSLGNLITSDLDIFFSSDGFAVQATYEGRIINVIFDSEYQALEMLGGGVGVESSSPSALCKTSDVSNAKHGDTLTISGTTYYVTGVQPDGTGITRLLLSKDMANV